MINIIDTYILQWNINDEGINTIRLCFFFTTLQNEIWLIDTGN